MKKRILLPVIFCSFFAVSDCFGESMVDMQPAAPAETVDIVHTEHDSVDMESKNVITDEILEWSVDDIDKKLYDGIWYLIIPGYEFYLPEDWTKKELQEGAVFYGNQDQTEGIYITPVDTKSAPIHNIAEAMNYFPEARLTQKAVANGIEGVYSVNHEETVYTYVFFAGDEVVMLMAAGDEPGEKLKADADNIFCSVRTAVVNKYE